MIYPYSCRKSCFASEILCFPFFSMLNGTFRKIAKRQEELTTFIGFVGCGFMISFVTPS